MNRRLILVAAIVAVTCVVLAGLVMTLGYGEPRRVTVGNDKMVSNLFTPADGVAVANLTIDRGNYRVGYTVDVLFYPQITGTTLNCTLVDPAGRFEFHGVGSIVSVPAGRWTKVSYASVFDLPDLTIGIRCKPSARERITAVFRSIHLFAEPSN